MKDLGFRAYLDPKVGKNDSPKPLHPKRAILLHTFGVQVRREWPGAGVGNSTFRCASFGTVLVPMHEIWPWGYFRVIGPVVKQVC